jgi:ABC-2 type transport system permease protein
MYTYWLETKFEFLSLLRMPRFAVPTLAIPALFYAFFGIAMPLNRGVGGEMARVILVGYAVFGALAASMWGVAVALATERNLGWLEVKRASPMRLPSYFAAKVLSSMAFGLLSLGLLAALGLGSGRVDLSAAQWFDLCLCVLAASVPFTALGLLVGSLTTANSTPAIVNLIAMPMAICTGLWMPIDFLPEWMQRVAVYLPSYHALQIGRTIIGRSAPWAVELHLAAMLGFALLFLGLTAWAWRRQRQ